MRKYRITKYDPALRNEDGWYMPDDWIDWSDIGKTYNGNMLDACEYKEMSRDYTHINVSLKGIITHR